ncbi:Thiol-disulfide isomerase or thioredoxin [Polaribacter sp. KT25b]|uniref:thioredoxin family protein n=1 Tax=Polaribacter sp. KT25b TaxID=1855336 RepID=UPI0008795135|nr:thioredoxin family protein [Polaribacter sp. KT25b]SDR66528.1 Thiol-disulfide isomerase or thioredoxin [Polaribacter sp. KT25b]
MKKSIIIFLIAVISACNSTKKVVETKTVETKKAEVEKVKQITREITAKKDANGYLIGVANKDSFKDESFKNWFNSRYNEYTTDKETVNKLKTALEGYTIKGFMSSWCGDSKRETPRFYKLLDETGFNQNDFELITVDRSKKTPDNLQEGFNIIRVPTFIFYKEGKEVGRYVEYPRETLEKDILKIVTNQPYKHSYDRSE